MKKYRDESGFAMITAVLFITIAAGLTTVVLTTGSHSDRSSQRGRNWTVALQTADSGVQRAIAYMQGTSGVAPAPFTGTTADGTYNTTVTSLGRHRYQIDSAGAVGKGAGLVTARSVRVVLGPPLSFRYALFSLTDVNTKNNNYVQGDIWANGNVTVQQNDTVNGSANAATGWVFLDNGSTVTGSVTSGGYTASNGRAIDVSTNASVGGTARPNRRRRDARTTSPIRTTTSTSSATSPARRPRGDRRPAADPPDPSRRACASRLPPARPCRRSPTTR
jgi:hypothetical protein